MSNAKEKYTVNRSEFTRQEPWILDALADSPACLGFFVQFQSAFGRSAAPNDNADFKGLYMSQYDMAALMNEAGIKLSTKTVNNNMNLLCERGIISKAPVCDPGYLETASRRIVWVYVINKTVAHEFDRLAEKLALEMLDNSKYKGQAKGSALKKERLAKNETHELVKAREIARLITEDNKLKGYIVNYLTNEGTVQGAINAVHDLKTYTGRITENAFIQGTKSFKSAPLTPEQTRAMERLRDDLNRARQMDRKPAEIHVEPVINIPAPTPTPSRVFKTQEQLKAEAQMRRDDIEAEKERQLQLEFEDMLASIDL